MTPFEIAQKYVYGQHDALTDKQEIINMIKDIEQAISEQLILSSVSQQRELLPDFLYGTKDNLKVGVHGDTNVTDEWNDYLKKLGNCG